MDSYKTFPPRWSHIRVPVSSRTAAKAAIGLYAPCAPKGYAVQRAAWLLVATLGPRALPGRTSRWQPPVGTDDWQDLLRAWADMVGGHDEIAVYQRPQRSRAGFALLLLRRGDPLAFVRLRHGPAGVFDREQRVLHSLGSAQITSFWHPDPIGIAAAGSWQSLLTTAMRPAPHRAVDGLDAEAISGAISEALRFALARPDAVPRHWQPMHGDLTPWNVRLVRRQVAVIDWEDAGWGPPHADATLYRAASAALRGGRGVHRAPPEAAAFWLHRLRERPADWIDAAFASRLRTQLERMATAH